MKEDKIITQLSIFVNNEPGRLASVCRIIKNADLKVRAFNLAESAEFGILRAIVENPEQSFESLREKGIIVRKTDIIAISVTNATNSFFVAADKLGSAGINIEYGYFYTGSSGSVLFVRVDDTPRAVEILEEAGVRLLDDTEI
ncbi:amino acid-binding protein [Candidatus Methanoprimaticola sp. MG2]|uniref:amino acid-binding protein n=1 Tax=Candidatus Methanoprimaticola sp. MG2 TaxID=3228838 RepID=UPI0039C6C3B1